MNAAAPGNKAQRHMVLARMIRLLRQAHAAVEERARSERGGGAMMLRDRVQRSVIDAARGEVV